MFYKVDRTKARGLLQQESSWHPDFKRFPPTRAPYGREPYVRARLGAGAGAAADAVTVAGADREAGTAADAEGAGMVDAKAIGWTREHVHLKWQDADFRMHTRWVPAAWVRRISRDESAWQDPYDIEPGV
jgi:hypothetical protein